MSIRKIPRTRATEVGASLFALAVGACIFAVMVHIGWI